MVLQNLLWFNNPRLGLTSLLIFHLLFLHSAADNPILQPRKANCTGLSYTKNSPFATSLAAVLSSLTAKSSSSNSAVSNVTTRNSSDHVYGLFMCQGDLAGSDCQTCVRAAATAITTNSCSTYVHNVHKKPVTN
ncbi:putative cysteine-rich receptor-like protein kinase 9 [Asparagus officinalis]|uniref:putative cysteine-rich receptor-like protein kinase 9 n=1 Tax=Asparagus officinalis TaxID=4686 RepID=UPI00098E2A2A|nr:putative cysteine-rich receptor-like protein kinase 9 [Asparagus officinalis]